MMSVKRLAWQSKQHEGHHNSQESIPFYRKRYTKESKQERRVLTYEYL